MTSTTPTTSRCEFCGATLQVRDFALPGHRPIPVTMPCTCPKAVESARCEEEDALRAERRERFREAWARSGVPERYLHVKAERAHYETLAAGRSLYIVGPNGRGKTYLACQVAKHYLARNTYAERGVIRCHKSLRFVAAEEVMLLLRSSWDRWDQTEEDVFQRLLGVDLLVLDDLGKGNPTEWAAENTFHLINDRYANMKPTIFTSQYSPGALSDRFRAAGDATVTAMKSRLLGWCEGIRLEGPDRRLENGED